MGVGRLESGYEKEKGGGVFAAGEKAGGNTVRPRIYFNTLSLRAAA